MIIIKSNQQNSNGLALFSSYSFKWKWFNLTKIYSSLSWYAFPKMKLHNHSAIAVQWTPTSQDEARTLLPPEYKKKEEESQIEAKRSSGFTLRLASLKTKNQDWWSNGQAIADLYAAKGWNIFCILEYFFDLTSPVIRKRGLLAKLAPASRKCPRISIYTYFAILICGILMT